MIGAAPAVARAPDLAAARAALAAGRHRDRGVLLEHEAYALLAAAGIAVPRHAVFELPPDGDPARALPDPPLAGARVVLKLQAPDVLHKTEAGGVAVVPNVPDAILDAVATMERRCGDAPHAYLLAEHVPHESAPGHELLLGMRMTDEFGPVVTLGPGGVATEFLSRALRDDSAIAVLSPALDDAAVAAAVARLPLVELLTRPLRGRPPRVALAALLDPVRRMLALARELVPDGIEELEVNPLVLSRGRFVALDALLTLGRAHPAPALPRPLARLENLLRPRTIAVMGVSERLNPGRVILQNVLKQGFDRAAVTVIKPGVAAIDGCRCVPAIAALPAPTDLLILSIAAAQAPAALGEILATRKAESVILIPGGLGEKPGSEPLVAAMQQALRDARAGAWGGPVINGGNCLGVRSLPGRYNTLFIAEHKFPPPGGPESPLAVIAGSGAFVVSKTSKLAGINPRYLVSVGNQLDLTLADYLEVLARDPAVEVFAVYAEGFRPLDGGRFLDATRAITASGRSVILYRAGRTAAGSAAAASHTAAVAGDYAVTRALAAAAGAIVADSLEEFEDLMRLFVRLRGRAPGAGRLGALSNAGFESVAIADNLGRFTLAEWSEPTRAGIGAVLERARLADIVSVRNPLDLTPLAGDADTAEVARLVLGDGAVDVGLIGCVPMTQALDTLAPGAAHGDDVRRADSLASRLIALWRQTTKPWGVVVDAGALYDPMAAWLEESGVPVFRTADRALRALGRWAARR